MADPISKPAMEIYHWGYPGFWLILSSQNDPLLGPQFHPPVFTQLEVPGPASFPVGHWPCPCRASHAWE